jgi:hypothetical protein
MSGAGVLRFAQDDTSNKINNNGKNKINGNGKNKISSNGNR